MRALRNAGLLQLGDGQHLPTARLASHNRLGTASSNVWRPGTREDAPGQVMLPASTPRNKAISEEYYGYSFRRTHTPQGELSTGTCSPRVAHPWRLRRGGTIHQRFGRQLIRTDPTVFKALLAPRQRMTIPGGSSHSLPPRPTCIRISAQQGKKASHPDFIEDVPSSQIPAS